MRPPGTEAMSEEALAALVTRDSMIGVVVPGVPLHPAHPNASGTEPG
jgi:nitrile hydratase subunit alpha